MLFLIGSYEIQRIEISYKLYFIIRNISSPNIMTCVEYLEFKEIKLIMNLVLELEFK